MGILACSENPDEIYAAFHQGLHCLLRLKQPSVTEIRRGLKDSTCDPLKYTLVSLINIETLCMWKSIKIQRVEVYKVLLFLLDAAIKAWHAACEWELTFLYLF